MSKKRVVKDFDKLPDEVQNLIRKEFPAGFAHKLVSYQGPKGERISALPFETEDTVYLVRWSIQEFKPVTVKDDDLDEVFTRDDIPFDDVETTAGADDENDDYSSDDYGLAGGSGSDSDDRDDNDY